MVIIETIKATTLRRLVFSGHDCAPDISFNPVLNDTLGRFNLDKIDPTTAVKIRKTEISACVHTIIT